MSEVQKGHDVQPEVIVDYMYLFLKDLAITNVMAIGVLAVLGQPVFGF